MCQANTKRDERLRVPRSELLIMHVRHTHRTHPRIRAPMRCARVDTGLCLVYDDDDCKTERTVALFFFYFYSFSTTVLDARKQRVSVDKVRPGRTSPPEVESSFIKRVGGVGGGCPYIFLYSDDNDPHQTHHAYNHATPRRSIQGPPARLLPKHACLFGCVVGE